MPHIYGRAQTVLVWLGKLKIHSLYKSSSLRRLVDVDYWRRVWIVQEVGKARRTKIHYDQQSMEWRDFIDILENKLLRDCMPITLSNQMNDKYGDGYKLENLLRTHQKALCKDVRDKVYGFTGLANDTYGLLAMDYGKTPFQIWKDVVRFRNQDSTIPQHDIFQFAIFTRDLLGLHNTATTKNIRVEELPTELDKDDTIICPARLWGRISCVGPSLGEMRSNLLKVDHWTACLRTRVSWQYLRSAREENDLLLQLLEHINSSDLISIRQNVGLVTTRSGLDIGSAVEFMERLYVNELPPQSKPQNDTGDSTTECYPSGENLILLDIFQHEGLGIQEVSKNFLGIGFATSNARVGDFICYCYLSAVAVIFRVQTRNIEIIGTALVPDVHAMVAKKAKNPGGVKARFAVLNKAPLKSSEKTNIPLNFRTLHELLRDF